MKRKRTRPLTKAEALSLAILDQTALDRAKRFWRTHAPAKLATILDARRTRVS